MVLLEEITKEIKSEKTRTLSDSTPVLVVPRELFVEEMRKLYDLGLTHLSTIIALQVDNKIQLDYPVSSPFNKKLAPALFVETIAPLDDPKVPSIESVYPSSVIYEREVTDILGVEFTGVPRRERLLLPDDFPEGVYPLRKGFTGKELQQKLDELGVGRNPTIPLKEEEDYVMAVGPQHPTHKEPIRFKFTIEGEDIKNVELRLGFNHRGIEKALEQGTWIRNLYLIERICGICSSAHQLAYVLTAEKVDGILDEVPDRAQWLRVLVAELERIHSHILWYGVLAHDGGYDYMFHITWRDREEVMDLLEMWTGNRVNYAMMTIGGVRRDIDEDLRKKMIKKLKNLRKRVKEHKDILEREKTFLARIRDVGYLSKEDAIRLGAVGPTARASNINFDLRKDVPYAAYKEIPFKVHYRSEGDVYATMAVRLDETLESVDMCLYVLENLPAGDIAIKVKPRLKEGEAHTRVEAPRGEDIHYIMSDGKNAPYRHKVRAPTLANMTSLLHRFKSMQVADIPMIIRSIDPCIGCMERVTFVDAKTGKTKDISGEELISKANRKHRLNERIKIFEV